METASGKWEAGERVDRRDQESWGLKENKHAVGLLQLDTLYCD